MIYHMQNNHDSSLNHTMKKNWQKMQLILFFNKLLTDAEIWYWSTKLKIVCLVWTIKKIHHMINESLADIMIWTDHFITIQIMKQMTLISSFTDKLNLHLVRASQYCSQFHIDVWYCSDWLNIVSDTLSCLLNKIVNSKNWLLRNMLENIDDEIHIYHITVIKMLSDFWDKIKRVYLKDKKWKKII